MEAGGSCRAAAAEPKAGAGHRAAPFARGRLPEPCLVPGLCGGSYARGHPTADPVRDGRRHARVSEFTRASLTIEAASSFRSERVCSVVEGLSESRGTPSALRMDIIGASRRHGPEFVALALRGLCHRRGIDPAYIEPGKPWQNGLAESFHARLRDEFLDGEAFLSVLDAQVRLGLWRGYYKEERLHSSLEYRTPSEFAALWAAEGTKNEVETKALTGT